MVPQLLSQDLGWARRVCLLGPSSGPLLLRSQLAKLWLADPSFWVDFVSEEA